MSKKKHHFPEDSLQFFLLMSVMGEYQKNAKNEPYDIRVAELINLFYNQTVIANVT